MTTDLEKYIAAIPPERRERFMALHSLVMGLCPRAVVNMKYQMPTYHVGDAWVALANQRHYVSLYTCGPQHIEVFKANHPEIKTGKGCINFKDGDDLPVEDIKRVIRHAIESPNAGHGRSGGVG